jgi:hypothetical protein
MGRSSVEAGKNTLAARVDDGGFKPDALCHMTCSPPGVANQRKRALTL